MSNKEEFKPVSISQLKAFKSYLDGNECLMKYFMNYYDRIRTESGEAALKGMHFEYLVTGQEQNLGTEYEKNMVIHGKCKKNGDYYSEWDFIPEVAENFVSFAQGHKIKWAGGKTREFYFDGIRHKIITDIEAIYKNKPLIIDLKFTSSLTKYKKKEWSWKVDGFTDVGTMLHNGLKIWQALYYVAVLYISKGIKYDFLFYVQSSSEADKSYFPYFLEFTKAEILEFWDMINKLIKEETEIISMFDKKSFVGNYKHCVNCDLIDKCNSSNIVADFINVKDIVDEV